MAEYYTHFSVLLPVGAGNVEAALALYGLLEAELEAGSEAIGFAAEAHDRTDDTVWLWDGGGCGDPEHVITFAFRCAEAFGLSGRWGFHYGLSCSRPRLDGPGGGAQVLDLGRRRSLAWLDTDHWLAEQLDRAAAPAAPAATVLERVARARGWDDHAQASLLLGFIDTLTADNPDVAGRLRAHLAAASGRGDGFLCRKCGGEVFVSHAGTTHHVGRGLDGIDYALDLAETRSVCGCDHTALPEREP